MTTHVSACDECGKELTTRLFSTGKRFCSADCMFAAKAKPKEND